MSIGFQFNSNTTILSESLGIKKTYFWIETLPLDNPVARTQWSASSALGHHAIHYKKKSILKRKYYKDLKILGNKVIK